MKRNLAEFLTLFAVVSLLLSACGTEPHAPLEASPPAEAGPGEQPAAAVPTEAPSRGPKILHASIPFEGDIPTIDPALSQDTASIQIVQETFIGLTQLNEETSATEPGMAISWDGRANADGTQTQIAERRPVVAGVDLEVGRGLARALLARRPMGRGRAGASRSTGDSSRLPRLQHQVCLCL